MTTDLATLIATGANRADVEKAAIEAGHGAIVEAHRRSTKGELLASLVAALPAPPQDTTPKASEVSPPQDTTPPASEVSPAPKPPQPITRSEALAPIKRELAALVASPVPADPVDAERREMAIELSRTQVARMEASSIGLVQRFVRETQEDDGVIVVEDPRPPTAADGDALAARVLAGEDPAALGIPSLGAPAPTPAPPPTPAPAPPTATLVGAPVGSPAPAAPAPTLAPAPAPVASIRPAQSAPPAPAPTVEVPRLAAHIDAAQPRLGQAASVEVPHLGAPRQSRDGAGGNTRNLIVSYFREVATQGDRLAAELHNAGHTGAAQLVQLVANAGTDALTRIGG